MMIHSLSEISYVKDVFEICGQWEIMVGKKKIKFRLKKDLDQKYVFETDHIYYLNREQFAKERMKFNRFDTEEEAKEQIMHYFENELASATQGFWIKNRLY